MLNLTQPWGARVLPYRCSLITTTIAQKRWQTAGYWELRRRVFVYEQGLFETSDRDRHDDVALPIVALGSTFGMLDEVVGTVRIYPTEPDVWCGGRLAVARAYRRHVHVGHNLIRTAVGGAMSQGCNRFFAHVQQANVPYFIDRGFDIIGSVMVCGQPHAKMEARLDRFTPVSLPLPHDPSRRPKVLA